MMLQVKKSVFMILFDLFTNALIQDNRFSDIHFPHSKYYAFTCIMSHIILKVKKKTKFSYTA